MIQSVPVVLLSLVASHHDLDLTVLERLQSDVHAVGRELVAATPAVSGAVVLATCNRFELYLDVDDTADAPSARRAVAEAVAARSGYTPEDVDGHLHPLVGADASEHLFSVASGLESMVVGEREIAGQVRRALTAARRDGIRLSASSSFRTMRHQRSLCREDPGCRSGDYTLVAPPGYSQHQLGVAIDVTGTRVTATQSCEHRAQDPGSRVWRFLSRHAGRFGFRQYAAESWHWDALPGRARCGP